MEKELKKITAGDGRDRLKKASKPVFDRTILPPAGLVAKNPPPQPKLKHQAYFEFVENTNKKKQLEYQITVDKESPPGFIFVPNGKPELTSLCKEISREKDAMIFIVSTARDNTNELSLHTSRIGHHIREAIVEEAQATLGYRHDLLHSSSDGAPEPIPKTQEEINAQADAALRELFPRIPNTDRQEIIDHAFRKGATFHGGPVVGLSKDISLSRRVQLAVLAHIRHRHTRYDALLRETSWQHARKTVEAACLDMIVKWRGDEENGRDTLDSILREVVVISDSEGDEESDDEDSDELILISPRSIGPGQRDANSSAVSGNVAPVNAERPRRARNASNTAPKPLHRKTPTTPSKAKHTARALQRERRAAKKATRGFKRYQAAWEEAVDRNRHGQEAEDPQPSAGLSTQRSPGYDAPAPTLPDYNSPAQLSRQPRPVHSNSHVIYVGPARRPETTNPGTIQVDGPYPTRPSNLPAGGQISPRPVQPRVGEDRGPIMTRSLTNPSLSVGGSHGSHYQDLLVPSIEGPPPSAMAPQFVRSLPSRKHARDESPVHSTDYPPQPYTSAYPAEVVQDGHVKRRRVIGDRDGMAALPSDPYIRSPPPLSYGCTQREPEIRQPVSYPGLDSPQVIPDPDSRQVYYERRPQPVETRQHPIVVRQPNGTLSQRSDMIELRRGVKEPPSYRNHPRTEHIPESHREYRGAPVPAHHPEHHDQNSVAPRYSGHEYPSARQETHQIQRPSAQPIFVRTVEPRTVEVQPRHADGTRESRYAAPGDRILSQRWEDLPVSRAEFPGRGHLLEPFYEVNRQPDFASTTHGVPTTRPYLQEPIRMEPRHQQPHSPHLPTLPHAGGDRSLPPRDIFVYD